MDRLKKICSKNKLKLALKPLKTINKNFTHNSYYASKGEVYLITCQCKNLYVGMAKRSLNTRDTVHIRDAKNNEFLTFGFTRNSCQVQNIPYKSERIVYESIVIHKIQLTLNLGVY